MTPHVRWLRWLDVIEDEINSMVTNRLIYQRLREIIQGNDALPPSHFLIFVSGVYANAQAMAIRRQVDTRSDVVSIARLLNELANEPERVRRSWYVARWGPGKHMQQAAESAYDTLVGPGMDQPTSVTLRGFRAELGREAAKVLRYANEHVAHYAKARLTRPPKRVASFAELHGAVDAVYARYEWLIALLLQKSRATVEPTFQYDWEAIFRHPWLPQRKDRASR